MAKIYSLFTGEILYEGEMPAGPRKSAEQIRQEHMDDLDRALAYYNKFPPPICEACEAVSYACNEASLCSSHSPKKKDVK